MARIRTIKPEFWADEKLSSLSPIDRLVFLGLIGMADDYGRVHHNIKVIDAFIFPNTDDTSRESLATLSRIGRVRLGQASNGMQILEIINWTKHQRVDKPQKQGSLPPIEDNERKNVKNTRENTFRETLASESRDPRETLAPGSSTRDLGSSTRDLGSSTRDQGEGEGEGSAPAPTPLEGKSKPFKAAWKRWQAHQRENFTPLTPTSEEAALMELGRCFPGDEAEQVQAIEFSILRRAKNLITSGDHNRARAPNAAGDIGRQKTKGELDWEGILSK